MIQHDQPTCFPEELLVAVSSKLDGTVLDRAVGIHNPGIVTNRTKFCDANGISYGDVVYQRINYSEDATYDQIVHVSEVDTTKHVSEVAADALITDSLRVGLLLPVADCVATVVYDTVHRRLAVLHLGRHSTLANLMHKALHELIGMGSDPKDLIVWMAPSVQKTHYAMDYFLAKDTPAWQPFCVEKDGKIYLDLQGYNAQAAIDAGVPEAQIHISPVNTATDENYFSHSYGDTTGRFAVLAMINQ
jgi:hypothetical protein